MSATERDQTETLRLLMLAERALENAVQQMDTYGHPRADDIQALAGMLRRWRKLTAREAFGFGGK